MAPASVIRGRAFVLCLLALAACSKSTTSGGSGMSSVAPKPDPRVGLKAGMGIGVLIPISAVTTIFLGALADWIWERTSPESHQRYSIAIASGFIAGEAIVAVIIPLLVTMGLMKLAS